MAKPENKEIQVEEIKSVKKPDILKRMAEAPAEALDKTIERSEKFAKTIPTGHVVQKTKDFWHTLGPGLTTGASDDDPSGIATYSQTGAQYGFRFLWLSAFTFPLMAVVQEMCARIGFVTGRGLAGNIRKHFSRKLLYVATMMLFAANAFNIGADLGAMAQAAKLLRPSLQINHLLIGFAVASMLMQILTPYARYARYLKWLALVLLAYIYSALLAQLNWSEVGRAVVIPKLAFNKDELLLVCAILGTTISPYLFFWQTSQEVEDKIALGQKSIVSRQGASKQEIKNMRIDVWFGMLLSNVVMFFIIAACGGVLHKAGITNITTAAQAAEALRPFAGDKATLLFAIGIICTGLLAIPVLAGSSSYAIAESLAWKGGLNRKLKQAYAFYGVIMISMLVGLGMNFIGLDPIKALIYSAIGNGIVAPLILAFIVLLSSNKKVMGEEWVNKPLVTAIGWFVTILMAVAGVAAIGALFF